MGFLVFGITMAVMGFLQLAPIANPMGHAIWELGGAMAPAAVIGVPAAWLSGRLKPGEPILVEALAIVLLLAAGRESLWGMVGVRSLWSGAAATGFPNDRHGIGCGGGYCNCFV